MNRIASYFFSSRRRHTRFDCDWSSRRVLFRSLKTFLRPEDVGNEIEAKIIDAGKHGAIQKGEGEEQITTFEIGVMLPSGERKIWTVNKTSQRTIASVFGKKTEAWVNKVVTLFTVDQNVRGTIKKVIYARMPK